MRSLFSFLIQVKGKYKKINYKGTLSKGRPRGMEGGKERIREGKRKGERIYNYDVTTITTMLLLLSL
jgi:hypothetical protein